ncbi:MAG: Xaa-Pro dipeptidase [Spirochaetota bacterium]
MSNIKELYKNHINELNLFYSRIIEKSEIKGIIIHSGKEKYYFKDDQPIYFKAFHHFMHWIPYNEPDCFIEIIPDRKARFYYPIKEDFWYDTFQGFNEYWTDFFEIIPLKSVNELFSHIIYEGKNYAYLGDSGDLAVENGIEKDKINPDYILYPINYNRRLKDKYELYCTEEATKTAYEGHKAARNAFYNGKSEFEINLEYLNAIKHNENETPYPNIIAINDKASVLHYEKRKTATPYKIHSFLIDAGTSYKAYSSDITRTYVYKDYEDSVFNELIKSMETLQKKIIAEIEPSLSYIKLHETAHRYVADILKEFDIVRLSPETILEKDITSIFFPHGLGHLLGIQAHEVGGHYKNEKGEILTPPARYPFLRLTQDIQTGHLFTIEPGFYFIDSLLQKLKTDKDLSSYVNWDLIDELKVFGGVRIEDNIYIDEGETVNITRKYFDM